MTRQEYEEQHALSVRNFKDDTIERYYAAK